MTAARDNAGMDSHCSGFIEHICSQYAKYELLSQTLWRHCHDALASVVPSCVEIVVVLVVSS